MSLKVIVQKYVEPPGIQTYITNIHNVLHGASKSAHCKTRQTCLCITICKICKGSVKSVYVKLQGFRVPTWYSLDES